MRKSTYDCVLMDIQMDRMNGLEATKFISSGVADVIDPKVPIIAMTTYAMSGDREKFLAAGMAEYIAKPVTRQVLQQILDRIAREG